MNKIKFTVLAIVAAIATTASASDIEFHGYMRGGIALNTSGGTGACYHLNGADTDFRLGNECDWVVEPNFDMVMAKLDDKSTWGVHIMPKVYKRWQSMGGRDLDTMAVWLNQAYFYGSNLPWLGGGTIWAGRKYWDRLQLGINDQFVEREDSTGFGFEDANLGFGKLSFGVGLEGENGPNEGSQWVTIDQAATKQYRVSARLTGIQTFNKDSSLQIWAAYYGSSRNTNLDPVKIDSGYRLGIYHNFGMGSAGNLFVGAKIFKNNAISGADGQVGNADSTQAWRVFAQYGVNIASARTSVDILAEYRDKKAESQSDHGTWYTVGFRTDTQISGPFRFLLEAGYDSQKDPTVGDGSSTNLLKVTPVLAISAGNDPWSRPTFRLYYTYASWSDVGVLDGWSSEGTQDLFGTKKTGGTFGVQAEGWW
jgi:maltoporin